MSAEKDNYAPQLDESASALPTGEFETKPSMGRYLATRFSTLKPPMAKVENPFKLLALLNTQQWLFFFVGFAGWTWDAFDFFTVSLTVSDLAKTFDKTNAQSRSIPKDIVERCGGD